MSLVMPQEMRQTMIADRLVSASVEMTVDG
jgi:hypothetical protein